MASARKKQDEKNLKFLRELVSLPGNKHCFDCNQRGPTYVNMTIGSFVCTKCSGMLRGLTPPHRVKSISMASFTSEEVDLVKSHGNDYCRQTWLALYDQNSAMETTTTKDEQQIKDFMIEKYEKKSYYHDKPIRNDTIVNNNNKANSSNAVSSTISSTQSSSSSLSSLSSPPKSSSSSSSFMTQNKTTNNNKSYMTNGNNNHGSDFVADFNSADIFSSSAQFEHTNNNGRKISFNANAVPTSQPPLQQQQQQQSFANFDNAVFNSTTYQPNSYDLIMNQLTQMPNYVVNKMWNVTPQSLFNSTPTPPSNLMMNKVTAPPTEDRYAALKDLDNALKNQSETQFEWHTPSSNGSGYASSPNQSSGGGSFYGSPSQSGSSMYGSPSQSHFMTAFPQNNDLSNNISNPFSPSTVRNPWTLSTNNGINSSTVVANNFGANPFRNENNQFNGNTKFNGLTTTTTTNDFNNGNHYQPSQPSQNGVFHTSSNISSQNVNFANKPWNSPNPFTLGVSPSNGGNSNNPFL